MSLNALMTANDCDPGKMRLKNVGSIDARSMMPKKLVAYLIGL